MHGLNVAMVKDCQKDGSAVEDATDKKENEGADGQVIDSMKPSDFNSSDLILRSRASQREAGRLEG
jgi:hypothetical protein